MNNNKYVIYFFGMLLFSGMSYADQPTNRVGMKAQVPSNQTVSSQQQSEDTQVIQDSEQTAKDTTPLPPFNLTRQAAEDHLALFDQLRQFDDRNIELIAASTPFLNYYPRLTFKATDFADGKIIKPKKLLVHWTNSEDVDWKPSKEESLCNTEASGYFTATVTAVYANNVVLTKQYAFKPGLSICHLKPLDMTVIGEHNFSANFDPEKGFSGSTRRKFPTTAFNGAIFEVVLNGEFQPSFTLRSSHQYRGVERDTARGKTAIKFTQRPQGVVVLELRDLQGMVVDTYAFKINKWFINQKNKYYQWDAKVDSDFPSAETVCREVEGDYRVPSRVEVTNAKFDKKLIQGSSTGNYFRRAVDEGLFAEWGNLNTYPNAFWRKSSSYWLLEDAMEPYKHFLVNDQGGFKILLAESTAFVMCTNRR